jgi:hypothetical protein
MNNITIWTIFLLEKNLNNNNFMCERSHKKKKLLMVNTNYFNEPKKKIS